jgi:LacI family transcriptional regulator
LFGAIEMESVNLKKLAKELNLATSTVSRALRDSHEISLKTKDRVKALAKEWGFQPNPHASSLRKSKSNTIAVIIPEIENNFFSQVMSGVEAIAGQKRYHVLIYLTHEDQRKEKAYLQSLSNGRVDGLMISISNTTNDFEHVKSCEDAGIPMVQFDRICTAVDVPTITTDDSDITFKATEHLIKQGCTKIAFLSMSSQLSITSGRKSGYLKAIQKYGAGQEIVAECSQNDAHNREIIKKMINESAPDGIFAATEKFAINTYQVCEEMGIHIPSQLKLVSFSNLAATAFFNPPLSTVVQPAYEIGKRSAEVLFKIIEKKALFSTEKKIVLPSRLVERGSSS